MRNPEGKIRLYCKGADTILLDRLHPCTQELLSSTTDHLNVGVMPWASSLLSPGRWPGHALLIYLFKMIYLFSFYMPWYFLCIPICVRVLDPPQLELQIVVGCHVGARN